jgi:ABC-2 type transport system ATP-binding protein
MYIELKNVTKKIRGVTVLDNVSLRMESGNIYGFKGKNGSGKTMLMRAVAGLIRVDGIVDINGKIMGKDMMFPDSIGILIENPAFINNYTGFENLKTLASIRERIDDERIRETLSEVGLDPNNKKKFKTYSLGMKQRLGIAAAIMEKPDIILLDEPINALDDSGTEQVSKLLMKHKERGALIIIACHDAEELDYLSDDIIEIAEGRIKNNKADKGGTN